MDSLNQILNSFSGQIADGSVSSTDLSSPDKKYPIIELPLLPSELRFFNIGPDKANPNKL